MIEEVRQQPSALAKTLKKGFRDIRALQRRFSAHPPRLVVIAARGTSDNAAEFGRYLIEITTRIPVSLAAPSIVTLYKKAVDLRDVAVVGISQSGESTDVNAVLEDARKRGAITIGITNDEESTMANMVDHTLFVGAGKERSIAATKTYTSELLAVYLLAYALGGNIRLDDLRRIPACVSSALRTEECIAELAVRYRFMNRSVTVGRGLNYANALEFGLKMIETSYVLTGRFSAADLMHGPIALVEPSLPAFVFAPPGVTWPSIAEVLERLRQMKAETLVITDRRNTGVSAQSTRCIRLPWNAGFRDQLADLYTPIPYIVPAQLFTAHLAIIKGFDPDRPRTLTKVTQTM
jgi:glucosamine--fructose-6-phosphate aminotransferase (isomerizing)